jgi:hypothetical protein
LSAIWLLKNCQALVKSLSDCSLKNFPMLAHNVQGLWSGGGFETRPPERLPI